MCYSVFWTLWRWALFAGGVRGAGDAGGKRCMLPCMLEVTEGGLCVLRLMRCVLLCMQEAAEGGPSFGFSKFPFLVTVRHRVTLIGADTP